MFHESSPYSAHWPPVWLPRLLSDWSDRKVPLTLVLRLLASAELRIYRTSLPRLIVLKTISSLPLWLDAGCPLRTHNLPATRNYGTQLVRHRHVKYEATKLLGVFYGFIKRPLLSLLEKQRNRHHDVWFLIINIQVNGVSIVRSVITKIFNPCKYWTVTVQPFI
jgi:hypothetical protein